MNAFLAERIVSDPSEETGSARVRDTGVSVIQVLDALVRKPDAAAVLERYPVLELADVQAVIEFVRDAVTADHGSKTDRQIADLGWTVEEAANLRLRLQAFAEDWDDPSMDVYDEPPPAR